MIRKFMLGVLIVLMAAGCAAPQPTRPQATPRGAAAAPAAPTATATRARQQQQRPTQTPEPTATGAPTVAPTMPPKPTPTATALPADGAGGNPSNPQPASGVPSGVASGVVLALSPWKYPAPTLLTPDNNMTYHISQPVVHMAWSAAPTDLVKFGQMTGCVSDATNYRRALESYQLVVRSLDVQRPDLVQWTEIANQFDFNLTTVPQGRYAWSVSVVALCESYVVGQKGSTTQRTLLGSASPTSAPRVVNWVP